MLKLPPVDREARFLAKVVKDPSGCWMWQGSTGRKGYGRFWNGERLVQAHRWAYGRWRGPLPPGPLDHRCDTPRCVNPTHLEPTTHRENILRGNGIAARNAVKQECSRGHPYTPENTYRYPDGRRSCRVCRAEDVRRFYGS